MNFNLDRRTLAILGAVGTAALVAAAETVRELLAAGQVAIDPTLAAVLAAALGGGLAAYAEARKSA